MLKSLFAAARWLGRRSKSLDSTVRKHSSALLLYLISFRVYVDPPLGWLAGTPLPRKNASLNELAGRFN